MITTLAKAGFALTLSVGAICASVLPASAQDMELRIGPNGVRPVIRDNQDNRDRDMRRAGCSPSDARDAALDEGFRRPQVTRVTNRSVTVEGMTRDGMDRIVFANRPGCPEM
ncbi:MAG: hypothetical protein PW791_12620 [Neorhizobium sp.]|jgi:hypothetical protein|nr:hypothetical protein [Neorhizobium sp.]